MREKVFPNCSNCKVNSLKFILVVLTWPSNVENYNSIQVLQFLKRIRDEQIVTEPLTIRDNSIVHKKPM